MFLSTSLLPVLFGWADWRLSQNVVIRRKQPCLAQTTAVCRKLPHIAATVLFCTNHPGKLLTVRIFSLCCPKKAFWAVICRGLCLSDIHKPKMPGNWIGPVRNRLAAHRAEKPTTKAGQIRALWPEIEAALAGEQSMKSIRQWLEED